MDILVIGAGPVGRTLAGGWSAAGHTVSVAVREPSDTRHDPYRAGHRLVNVADLPAAETTVLAIPGAQLPALLDLHGRRLDGRLVLDATNTVGRPQLHQLPLLMRRLPQARVYRTFTTIGWENFHRDVAGERPDMLYAGPDSESRHIVEDLIAALGPRPLRVGAGPQAADLLDAMTRLWFALAVHRELGRHVAVRVLAGPAQTAAPAPAAAATPRTVAIVGRGRIGSALGEAWARAGHVINYGVRKPPDDSPAAADGPRESDIATALARSEIVVLAVPGSAVPALLSDHREALRGRLIVNAANSLADDAIDPAALVTTISGARYARAFNTLGVENLLSPRFADVPGDMFFTAPHTDRPVVAELITTVGLRPVWLPPVDEAVIDGLLPLWFALAQMHGRHVALRILTTAPELKTCAPNDCKL